MRIVVTQAEIDAAHKAKSNGCMIHQAIKRDHPEFSNIWVDKNQIRCTDPELNCIYTFQMHPRGRVAILRWDGGEDIGPFDFIVQKPIVRMRIQSKTGHPRPKSSQQRASEHLGPVPRPLTKAARLRTGKDRVFGLRQWKDELDKIRTDLGVSSSTQAA